MTVAPPALAATVGELKSWGAGVIVVGHRPSTLAQADKVLVIKDGCVAMCGPREQVLHSLQKLREQATATGERSGVVLTSKPATGKSEPARLEAGVG